MEYRGKYTEVKRLFDREWGFVVSYDCRSSHPRKEPSWLLRSKYGAGTTAWKIPESVSHSLRSFVELQSRAPTIRVVHFSRMIRAMAPYTSKGSVSIRECSKVMSKSPSDYFFCKIWGSSWASFFWLLIFYKFLGEIFYRIIFLHLPRLEKELEILQCDIFWHLPFW